MRHLPALTGILAILGCDYTPPDAEFDAPLNVIAGTVDVAGVESPANTVILVTDAANPGPPVGTGSPATFATVPAAAFSDPTDAGLSGAPWAVTNVPDGNWVITALMDEDNDFFFSSAVSALAGATCGDALGAHVDSTGALAPVPTENGSLVDEVTIEISTVLTTERPAFTLEAEEVDGSPANGSAISLSTAADPGAVFPQQFKLSATAVAADVHGLGEYEYRLDGPFDPTNPLPCQTGFLARLVDANLDGIPDELPGFPGFGLLDMWPRVFLSYTGVDDEGATWAAQAAVSPFMRAAYEGTADGVDNDGDSLVDEANDIPLNTPLYFPEISVTWLPGARRTLPDGTSEVVFDPAQIPTGRWAVTVVNEAGQTWTVPNQLAGWPSFDEAWVPARQAEALLIEP